MFVYKYLRRPEYQQLLHELQDEVKFKAHRGSGATSDPYILNLGNRGRCLVIFMRRPLHTKRRSSWQLLNGVGMGPELRSFHNQKGSSTSREMIPKPSVSSSWCTHYRLSYSSYKELICYLKSSSVFFVSVMCSLLVVCSLLA